MNTEDRRQERVTASLKVRYKSATVMEFIEQNSHDISRGGVFVRSQQPLTKGSLLKLDFRLEDDTAVIQGVGRVVWTREDLYGDRPPGMGIKFIRLDEASEKNIEKIILLHNEDRVITRASLYGEAPEDASSYVGSVEETSGEEEEPSVQVDSADTETPAVSDETSDEASHAEAAPAGGTAETSSDDAETEKEGSEEPSVSSSGTEESSSSSNEKTADSKRETTSETSARPKVEEKKKSGKGIVVLLSLLVVGALVYFAMDSGDGRDASDSGNVVLEGMDEDVDGPEESELQSEEDDNSAVSVEMDTTTETDLQTDGDTDSLSLDDSDTASTEDADTATENDSDSQMGDTDVAIPASGAVQTVPAVPAGTGSGEVIITTRRSEEGIPVAINGNVVGVTPLTLPSLAPGKHTVTVDLFGYRPYEKVVTAELGEPLSLEMRLRPSKTVATFRANVLGAAVFVDGKNIGKTPMRVSAHFKETFTYKVEKPKFKDVTGTVTRKDWNYKDGNYFVTLDIELESIEDESSDSENAQ